MRIALDLDGVIAGGAFIPKEQQNNETYVDLPLLDTNTGAVWNRLAKEHELYIITARRCARAFEGVVLWLDDRYMTAPKGIFTGIDVIHKWHIAEQMGAQMFVDDHPQAVGNHCGICKTGAWDYLMDNPGWEANQKVVTTRRIMNWLDLEKEVNARKHTN